VHAHVARASEWGRYHALRLARCTVPPAPGHTLTCSLHQAAQKAAEDTPAGSPLPPARGRRNSGLELELGLDGGAGEARRRGGAAQEMEFETLGLDGAEFHAPNRLQLAGRDRRTTTSDAAV
jgi:hypothetical protein